MKKKIYCFNYLNALDPIKEEEIYDEKMLDEDMNFISNYEPESESEYDYEYESSEKKDLNCCNYLYFCFVFLFYF